MSSAEQYIPALGVGLSTAFFLSTWLKRRYKVDVIKIDELWLYPIKSCKGIKLNKIKVGKRGFLYDREYMVVDSENRMVTIRKFPKMVLIETSFNNDMTAIMVSYPGKPFCTIKLDETSLDTTASNMRKVTVWSDECECVDLGDELASWFSEVLQTDDLRLVRMAPSFVRPTDPQYAPLGQTSLSDGYPFLLLSKESIDNINAKAGQHLVTAENFRPNIVVSGCATPFQEDQWRKIQIVTSSEKIPMEVVKPCARCRVPNVRVATGEFDPDNTVNKTLKSFRTGEKAGFENQEWLKELFVGQNLDNYGKAAGFVTVGDEIRVLSHS